MRNFSIKFSRFISEEVENKKKRNKGEEKNNLIFVSGWCFVCFLILKYRYRLTNNKTNRLNYYYYYSTDCNIFTTIVYDAWVWVVHFSSRKILFSLSICVHRTSIVDFVYLYSLLNFFLIVCATRWIKPWTFVYAVISSA